MDAPDKAQAAYARAVEIEPDDARLLFEFDQLNKRIGQRPEARAERLESNLALVKERDDLTVEYADVLNQLGRSDEALALIASRTFQPWEGGEGRVLGQYERAHLNLGRQALQNNQPDKAKEHFAAAIECPVNLGEARHLLANAADLHYWLGEACARSDEPELAMRHWQSAAEARGDFQEMQVMAFSEMTYYSALAMRRLGRDDESQHLAEALLAYAEALEHEPAKIDYFATSLPTMLLFTDDLQQRQTATALFLQAQALILLPRALEAQERLMRVLTIDPNHPLAADLLRMTERGAR